MRVEDIAKVCHETNRAYCAGLGDHSQPAWEDAPEWQRQSAISGVRFHMDSPHAGPCGSHGNWMKEKLADGWKYGPEKRPDIKEHPCLIPYDKLPAEQRLKDSLFVAVVRLLEHTVQS